jgi:hypothetical protein
LITKRGLNQNRTERRTAESARLRFGSACVEIYAQEGQFGTPAGQRANDPFRRYECAPCLPDRAQCSGTSA